MTPKQNSPPIIAHPHPSRHFLLLLSPPCQAAVEPDPAKLISDNSSSGAEDVGIDHEN